MSSLSSSVDAASGSHCPTAPVAIDDANILRHMLNIVADGDSAILSRLLTHIKSCEALRGLAEMKDATTKAVVLEKLDLDASSFIRLDAVLQYLDDGEEYEKGLSYVPCVY